MIGEKKHKGARAVVTRKRVNEKCEHAARDNIHCRRRRPAPDLKDRRNTANPGKRQAGGWFFVACDVKTVDTV